MTDAAAGACGFIGDVAMGAGGFTGDAAGVGSLTDGAAGGAGSFTGDVAGDTFSNGRTATGSFATRGAGSGRAILAGESWGLSGRGATANDRRFLSCGAVTVG